MALYHFKGKKGERHEIDDVGLRLAVKIKTEMQKDTGRAAWGRLVKMMKDEGYDVVQTESFRLLVKNFKARVIDPEDDTEITSVSELNKQIGELAIEKRDLQNIRRDMGKVRREMTDGAIFNRELIDAVRDGITINVVKGVKDIEHELTNQTLIAVLSDVHIGALVKFNGNKYDTFVAHELIEEYAEIILDRVNKEHPSEVILVGLGDYVEQIAMRPNQLWTVDSDFGTQQSNAIKFVSEFISRIAYGATVPVKTTFIGGNHDRFNGNKKDNIYGDTFSTTLSEVMKIVAEQVPNLTVVDPDTPLRTHLNVNGAKIKFVHGDIDKIADKGILGKVSQFDGRIYDAIVGGHLHSASIREDSGWIIQSGSIIGSNEYSDSLGVSSERSQVILMVDGFGNITPSIIKL